MNPLLASSYIVDSFLIITLLNNVSIATKERSRIFLFYIPKGYTLLGLALKNQSSSDNPVILAIERYVTEKLVQVKMVRRLDKIMVLLDDFWLPKFGQARPNLAAKIGPGWPKLMVRPRKLIEISFNRLKCISQEGWAGL